MANPLSPEDSFLKLSSERQKLTDQMKELAWQIVSDGIKELLCGEGGYLPGEEERAREWLIKPNRRLGKSPIEAVINNEAGLVRRILEDIIAL